MLNKSVLAAVALLVVLVTGLLYPLVPDSEAPAEYSPVRLEPDIARALLDFADHKDTIDALVIADSKHVLLDHGASRTPINTHSVRKSIMSVLIGMSVRTGDLNVQTSLAELGVDDSVMPLTALEKTATVADLLKARSGIYIEAAGETPEMKAARPQRGHYQPGENYYYNNWDFNTLGTVIATATGRGLTEHLVQLAAELEFEDFTPDHLFFENASGSEHDQYVIYLSARDLAKVGQMMLRTGRTPRGAVLITPEWVSESTYPYSTLTDRDPLDGYGYLWSLDSNAGTFWATGWGGQFMLVDPINDLVIVARNHTGRRLGAVLWLSVLGHSTQGRMADVSIIHQMLVTPAR